MALPLNLGYTQPLFILPFDHRASFLKKMFGITEAPTPEQTAIISDCKMIIYEGFTRVAGSIIPKEHAAILTDEQFGDAVLRRAGAEHHIICLCTEKSGQDEFDFEDGDAFHAHIEKYRPTFVKALLRYNAEGDSELNARQRAKLKILSDYCHISGYKFLIEPLIPATESHRASVGGDQKRYDEEIRPRLMVAMIREFQADEVEPDVWKIEGFMKPEHYQAAITQARSGGRDGVSAIVLGRGADAAHVEAWLRAGSSVAGIIGFAIGRTIFWDPLVLYKDGKINREQAAEQIAEKYAHFYRVFTGAA